MMTAPESSAADAEFPRADYLPSASLEMLRFRADLLSCIRGFFSRSGYWEAETPILSRDVIIDAHLEPFVTVWETDGRTAGTQMYLQTSPEAGMKRLLCAGAEAIYQITRTFRNGEFGRFHNPEFTMIEWYRVNDTHHGQMQFVEELVRTAFDCVPHRPSTDAPRARPTPVIADTPFERITYEEAFEKYAGTRVLKMTPGQLADFAAGQGIAHPPGLHRDDRDGWLNLLLAELVEPNLGNGQPVFLFDYPASQSALARVRPDDPPVAERFELYVQGIEICNGYHELTDPRELQLRMEQQAILRAAAGNRALPIENRLLAAMRAGLPDCAGVALGFDRLLQVVTGAESIAEVIAFPFDRA